MYSRVAPLTTILAAALALGVAGCGSSDSSAARSTRPSSRVAATATSSAPSSSTPTSSAPSSTSAPPTAPPTRSSATKSSASRSASTNRATSLPLRLDTSDATQVVTVVASHSGDTTATVQRWTKSGTGWRRVGATIEAYVGSDGIGTASERTSTTPAGSFTLTRAFGRDTDPGTALPYLRTTPDDYWISSPGPNYNTEQRCGHCGYDNGVNERLYYVTPEYEHAVVIDYNTRNAPGGVKQGRGSAFFLHVAHGEPTAGCVAIPGRDLVDVMDWLSPSAHPRILIGID